MVVEASLLFKVPDDFSLEDAAIVACQGGTAYYPLTRLGASGQDVLIVSGLGPVGLLATLFGSRMGAEVVGIDPSAQRRALAEALGARRTFDPTVEPIGEQVRAEYPQGADKLVEASGASAAHEAIGSLLRPLGMAALVGLGSSDFTIPLNQIVHRELIVFGTSIFPTSQYDDIWQFCRRHAIAPSQVVTERFPLERGAEAFRLADSASTGQGLPHVQLEDHTVLDGDLAGLEHVTCHAQVLDMRRRIAVDREHVGEPPDLQRANIGVNAERSRGDARGGRDGQEWTEPQF